MSRKAMELEDGKLGSEWGERESRLSSEDSHFLTGVFALLFICWLFVGRTSLFFKH